MQTEETWVEIGIFWVPEAGQQRVLSLRVAGIEAQIQSPAQSGKKGFRLRVPKSEQKQALAVLEELYPPKEKNYREHRKLEMEMRQKGQRNLIMGLVLAVFGLFLTLGSFVSTDGWDGVLFYGAILTGVFLALLGIGQMR